MIQKLQTHLTRFINWLENNSETRGIRSILRSNEDVELSRLYKEINNLQDRLRLLIDKLSNDTSAYDRLVNQAYSHIKRKEKSLKIPKDMFVCQPEEIREDREFRVSTIQELIMVSSSLKILFNQVNKRQTPKGAEQMAINTKCELLCDMILATFKDVSTVEGNLMNINN
jgi:hypothetical protein